MFMYFSHERPAMHSTIHFQSAGAPRSRRQAYHDRTPRNASRIHLYSQEFRGFQPHSTAMCNHRSPGQVSLSKHDYVSAFPASVFCCLSPIGAIATLWPRRRTCATGNSGPRCGRLRNVRLEIFHENHSQPRRRVLWGPRRSLWLHRPRRSMIFRRTKG